MRFINFFLATIFFFFFAATLFASAHGFGQIIENITGEYRIALEYEALEIYADVPIRLSFFLSRPDASLEDIPPYTHVWAYLAEQNAASDVEPVVFAGALQRPEFSPAGMTMIFPRPGNYVAELRFENGSTTVAESSFSLTVAKETEKETSPALLDRNSLAMGFLGIVIGTLGGFWFFRRKR